MFLTSQTRVYKHSTSSFTSLCTSPLNYNRRLALAIAGLSSVIESLVKNGKSAIKAGWTFSIRVGSGSRVRRNAPTRLPLSVERPRRAPGYAMIADLCRIVLLNSSVVYINASLLAATMHHGPRLILISFHSGRPLAGVFRCSNNKRTSGAERRADVLTHRGESQSRLRVPEGCGERTRSDHWCTRTGVCW